MVVKWAPPKNLGSFDEIYIKFVAFKFEGLDRDIFGGLLCDWGFQHVQSKFVKFVWWSHA